MATTAGIFFFHSPLPSDRPPDPSPEQRVNNHDPKTHIVLPHYRENWIMIGSDKKAKMSKWAMAEEKLTPNRITSYESFIGAIQAYNPSLESKSFNVLLDVLPSIFPNPDEGLTQIHQIISLAFHLKSLIRQPIPILKQGQNQVVHLSQQQVGSLLANAFLVLFPDRSGSKKMPSINFDLLYTETKASVIHRKKEKLKCIFNYFGRITASSSIGVLSFERRFLRDAAIPAWSRSQKPLRELTICAKGVIEKCRNSLQIDFAHKIVGGAILDNGLVQEEIRFVLNPELIVSRVFTEKLNDNEVLFMIGSEQFNKYTGYGDNFRWSGDYDDVTPKDEFGRRLTQIVAMDATYFGFRYRKQFLQPALDRELKKAYVAFFDPKEANRGLIATGNWGCGVYRGDRQFKLLIQLIAASEAERDLKFFTFHDQKLKKEFDDFHSKLLNREMNVGKLYRYLIAYGEYIENLGSEKKISVFDYIEENFFSK
ncbi:poly(ADP-ribose) glycohydrolase-like [Brevipalpus obovatus]|uniref:poly(ADP-ribose) glycohydrolase-like n=1 Tax=Brevipalpus obovatus TaxID=246614 RepID=UPI003D9F6D46